MAKEKIRKQRKKLEQRKKQRKKLDQITDKKSRIKTEGGGLKLVKNQIQSKLLIYTSLIFISNVLTALYKGYYFYSFLFGGLTITSLLFHSTGKKIYFMLDKIPIVLIVCYGGYMLYQKMENKLQNNLEIKLYEILFIISTFLVTIFLYTYGYYTKQYCYHINKDIGDRYHGLLHCICSIGHHCIILL